MSLPTFTPRGSGGFAAKWVATIAYVGSIVSTIVAGALSTHIDPEGGLIFVLAMLWALTYCVAALTWIYQSWAFLPHEMRRTASGRPITPGGAVGALFIPFYNLYWMFVIAPGLCDAINAAQAQSGRSPSAPRELATIAAVVQVIPYINWLLAPVLWIVYMFKVDHAKEELLAHRRGNAMLVV
jgi:MFS family permease